MPELDQAMAAVGKMAEVLLPESEVIGPASAFVSRAKDAYRKVIYIKSRTMRPLIQLIAGIDQAVKNDRTFNKVYIQFDMDPVSMY